MRSILKMLAFTSILILIIIGSVLLQGCKLATLKQVEPEYKTVQVNCEDKDYQIKIPGFMPDFTEFIEVELVRQQSGLWFFINFYTPDSKLIYGKTRPNHYRIFFSNIKNDCPGVLGLAKFFINDKNRYWLYDDKGLPYEVNGEIIYEWLNSWLESKSLEMQEKESPSKSI